MQPYVPASGQYVQQPFTGQFGQFSGGVGFTTYLQTGKQPDWKHTPFSSSIGNSEGSYNMMPGGGGGDGGNHLGQQWGRPFGVVPPAPPQNVPLG
eukprot:3276155-Pyramimonas_sp.AAC.1